MEDELEKDCRNNNTGELYGYINKGKQKKATVNIPRENWEKHFKYTEENENKNREEQEREEEEDERDIRCSRTRAGIEKAIKKLKTKKAAGCDQITVVTKGRKSRIT